MDKELEIKIKELFKYRKLPILLKLAGTNKKKEKVFYNQLIALQAAIYDLDLYLESNWKLDNLMITNRWKPIFAALDDLGVAPIDQEDYVKKILKYQKHEMNIRKGKFPTKYTMEYFYFYKSCDVKLIRRLIYDKFPMLNNHYTLADWRLFDLVTEVVDDLMDVEEDTDVYNGNRFLISAIELKKKKTFKVYDLFLNEMDERLEEDKWGSERLSKLRKWTEDAIYEVDELLDELVYDYPKNMINQSLLAKRFKKLKK